MSPEPVAGSGLPSGLRELLAAHRPGFSLPQPFYTDADVFRTDLDRVLMRSWLCVGHVARIPRPGDWFTVEIGGESFIVIRARDGAVHALANVCRHRGSRICLTAEGHAPALVCPYHQWTYDTDGSLLAARHMGDTFDRAPWGLARASVRLLEGFIFICPGDDPPDWEPVARDCLPHMTPHGFPEARICHTVRHRVRANWKLILENFRECYHCGGAHPEYCRTVLFAAALDNSRLEAEERRLTAAHEARWKAAGLETRTVLFTPDTWHLAWRFPLREGFVTQSLDGKPVGPVMGSLPDRDAGVLAITTAPNFWLEASSDYAVSIMLFPVSATESDLELTWYIRGDAREGADYDVERVTAVWKATAAQDLKLVENNQAGVNSRYYRPGPYAPGANLEDPTAVAVAWYLNRLQGAVP